MSDPEKTVRRLRGVGWLLILAAALVACNVAVGLMRIFGWAS